MTERGQAEMSRTQDRFQVGPSSFRWDGRDLTILVDEITVPFPSRLRGQIRLTPRALTGARITLDVAGRHVWWPIAPACAVHVMFDSPDRNWRGEGYFDSNWGTEPLENAFRYWTWSRAPTPDGALILYDVARRHADDLALALIVGPDGGVCPAAPAPKAALPATRWRVKRETRADAGWEARVAETLEDTPFYSRSLVETRLRGETLLAMHESLDLDRFSHPAVQAMLPFKMPRRAR